MGLEAQTTLHHGGKAYHVKALLESSELILRGEFKRKISIATLRNVRAQGAILLFAADGEIFALELDEAKAATWAKKITTPAPSLAEKLGLKNGMKAFVLGAVEDPDLQKALAGQTTQHQSEAAFFIAVVSNEVQFHSALTIYAEATQPIWLVNVKGAKSLFGEKTIREHMRARGFKDTKTCAVSLTLAATRYNR